MNILLIRNNAQMLMMASGKFEYTDMESFALEFDGYLLTKPSVRSNDNDYSQYNYSHATLRSKLCDQYNYHPAISSNTIHHPSWKV